MRLCSLVPDHPNQAEGRKGIIYADASKVIRRPAAVNSVSICNRWVTSAMFQHGRACGPLRPPGHHGALTPPVDSARQPCLPLTFAVILGGCPNSAAEIAMSHDHSALIAKFRETLTQQRYRPVVLHNYCRSADHFLRHLAEREKAVEAATPAEVSNYLRAPVRWFRKRRGYSSEPPWHSVPRAAIHALLRRAQKRWPPEPMASRSQRDSLPSRNG